MEDQWNYQVKSKISFFICRMLKFFLGGLKSIGVGLGIAGNPLRSSSKKNNIPKEYLFEYIYLRC